MSTVKDFLVGSKISIHLKVLSTNLFRRADFEQVTIHQSAIDDETGIWLNDSPTRQRGTASEDPRGRAFKSYFFGFENHLTTKQHVFKP